MPMRKAKSFLSCLLILLTFVVVMSFSGCGGSDSSSSTTNPPPPPPPPPPLTPRITLLDNTIDYGVVVLDNYSEKKFEIQNTGNADLTIGQLATISPPFSVISDDCSDATLSPTSKCSLTIRFSPTDQVDYSDDFDIPSNDSDTGVLTATLLGSGRFLNVSITRVGRVDQQDNVVKMIVSVTNRNGVPIDNLSVNNFSIFENGLSKQISIFSNVDQTPVSVGLVLDYSSSMSGITDELENAAKLFVDELISEDEAEVIKFASAIEVMQPFTDNITAIKEGIENEPLFFQEGTRLFDAVWDSVDSTSSRGNDRLAVVAMSDGRDSGSVKTINEVIDLAVENVVSVFTVGIGAVDNAAMQQMAIETGGQYFFAPSQADLGDIYLNISEILAQQYTIEYETTFPPGSTITIDVEVDDNGMLGEDSIIADI